MLYRVATLEDCAVLTSLRMEMRAERDPGFCKEDLIEITHAFFQRNIQRINIYMEQCYFQHSY